LIADRTGEIGFMNVKNIHLLPEEVDDVTANVKHNAGFTANPKKDKKEEVEPALKKGDIPRTQDTQHYYN